MGEGQGRFWEPTFNRSIKVRRKDDRLTADAGLLLVREADHRLGLTAGLAAAMRDRRDPERIRYTLTELLRQRIYALAQGCRAQSACRPVSRSAPAPARVAQRTSEQPMNSRSRRTAASRKDRLSHSLRPFGAEQLGRVGS